MPGKVIEKYWNKAKDRAAEQNHTEDWPYVMAIYQNMVKNKKKPVTKSAFLNLMIKVAEQQKDAGIKDRLGTLIKKTKAVYEKTEPLREKEIETNPKLDSAMAVLFDAFEKKKNPFKKVSGFSEALGQLSILTDYLK